MILASDPIHVWMIGVLGELQVLYPGYDPRMQVSLDRVKVRLRKGDQRWGAVILLPNWDSPAGLAVARQQILDSVARRVELEGG